MRCFAYLFGFITFYVVHAPMRWDLIYKLYLADILMIFFSFGYRFRLHD